MKFLASASAVLLFGAVALASPSEADVLAKAKAVYKRNSPIANILRKREVSERATRGPTDADILAFALNLEYLEAQFYQHAVTGNGLPASLLTGKGKRGGVSGGKAVPFKSQVIRQYAEEIAKDELNHVKALRAALGPAVVAQPAINIGTAFTAAAQAAKIIGAGQTFSPYDSDETFLLGAFLFEDVGVTAYRGAAPLISSKAYLGAAASILAVEAYHASEVRTTLFSLGQKDFSLIAAAGKAAAVIGAVDDGKSQGLKAHGKANIVPTDKNGFALARTPGEVLDIVYLTPNKGATQGGFFPNGLNGYFKTTAGAGN